MDASRHTHLISMLAASQHGNVTFDQLRSERVSRTQIQDRVECGWYRRRHHGVYAIGHVPASRESRYAAAVLALGREAVLSHRAAGSLWRILKWTAPPEVTVPPALRSRHRDEIVVHRSPVPRGQTITLDGIRCTTVLRTVLDLAAVLALRPLATALEEAQVRHNLKPDRLGAEVLSRRGYRGNGKLALLLGDAVDPAGLRSILELRFLKLCTRHAIERPLVNERIGDWTPDFYWPRHALVVETDGFDFHRTAAARQRDARKDAFMESLGLRVIRLTWTDVADAPASTADRIRAALVSVPSSVK